MDDDTTAATEPGDTTGIPGAVDPAHPLANGACSPKARPTSPVRKAQASRLANVPPIEPGAVPRRLSPSLQIDLRREIDVTLSTALGSAAETIGEFAKSIVSIDDAAALIRADKDLTPEPSAVGSPKRSSCSPRVAGSRPSRRSRRCPRFWSGPAGAGVRPSRPRPTRSGARSWSRRCGPIFVHCRCRSATLPSRPRSGPAITTPPAPGSWCHISWLASIRRSAQRWRPRRASRSIRRPPRCTRRDRGYAAAQGGRSSRRGRAGGGGGWRKAPQWSQHASERWLDGLKRGS